MVDRPGLRPGGGRLPRHPGRSLGHPVGHVLRPARRPPGPAGTGPLAGSADHRPAPSEGL